MYFGKEREFDVSLISQIFDIAASFGYSPFTSDTEKVFFWDTELMDWVYRDSFDESLQIIEKRGGSIAVYKQNLDFSISFEHDRRKESYESLRALGFPDFPIYPKISLFCLSPFLNSEGYGPMLIPDFLDITFKFMEQTDPLSGWALTEYSFEALMRSIDFEVATRDIRHPSTLGWVTYFGSDYLKNISDPKPYKIEGRKKHFKNGGLAVILSDYPWDVDSDDISRIHQKWLSLKD